MSYHLGIDLGTTFTAAATANGGPPTMLGLGNRAMQIPSVLFLQEDGDFLVGEPAERRGVVDPSRVAREFKRRLGDHVPLLVAGTPFSAEALLGRLLAWVVAAATERMGEPPETIIVTHPANWGPYKRELLGQTIALADVGAAITCPEPQAGAVQYAAQARVAVGDRIAVYDLGGGTFDVCVLQKTSTGFAILGAPDGIEHLGGIDFDEALFGFVRSALGDRLNDFDPDDPAVRTGVARLRRDCVEAKEALSSDVDTTVPVSLPGLSTTVRVTRGDFEGLIRPALKDTIGATTRAMQSAGVGPGELRTVVLVGGSSRIPLVTQLLTEHVGVATSLDAHPKHDIALGAVQFGRHTRTGSPSTSTVPVARPITTPPPPSRPTPSRLPPETTVAPPRSAAVPPSPPSALPPSPPTTAAEEPPQGLTRTGWTLPRRVLLAVAGVGAVVTALLLSQLGGDGEGSAGHTVSPSFPVTPSDTATAPGLPKSDPLKPDQLLVMMTVRRNVQHIFLADVGSAAPLLDLTPGEAGVNSVGLTADRQTLSYRSDADPPGTIRVARAADGEDSRLLFSAVPEECAKRTFRPAWNPVIPTEFAAICQDSDGRFGLYILRTDGTVLRELDPGQEKFDDVTYTENGRSLLFQGEQSNTWDGGAIYSLEASGKTPAVALTTTSRPGQDADPAVSPDGETVAFRRRVDSGGDLNLDLWLMNVDGTRPRPLLQGAPDDQDPTWSPDGRQIAFKSDRREEGSGIGTRNRVWVLDVDSGAVNILRADANAEQTTPAWANR